MEYTFFFSFKASLLNLFQGLLPYDCPYQKLQQFGWRHCKSAHFFENGAAGEGEPNDLRTSIAIDT